MEDVLIRTCERDDIDAIYQMELTSAQENFTYGFVPSTPDELVASIGDYFVVAVYQS